MSGLDVLKQMKLYDPKLVILIITAFGTTDTAIDATKSGAYDYILKPFDIPIIKKIIDEALHCAHLMRTRVLLDDSQEEDFQSDRIIGSSPAMQEVYKMIGRVAASGVNILLRGESGTGKELVARAIYQHGQTGDKPFLTVNCAAIPETLLESELFGYERGAFTGANRRRIGKFEQAREGTIFLDEIGDMTLSTQAKILRILQEGTFERLGGEQTIKVNIHIIAATNRNLEKLIEEGKFREDLYYRIKTITITLPPLRMRIMDIPQLADYFLNKYRSNTNKEKISFSPEVLQEMQKYHWPGNIRELENIIRRAIVLCKGNVIPIDLVKEEFSPGSFGQKTCEQPVLSYIITNDLIQAHQGTLYEYVIAETEKNLIVHVLTETGGNQVKTAKILGISRVMLSDRIEKYGIKSKISFQNK
jgi:DNA-binding NtrC family response regulator